MARFIFKGVNNFIKAAATKPTTHLRIYTVCLDEIRAIAQSQKNTFILIYKYKGKKDLESKKAKLEAHGFVYADEIQFWEG